MTKLAARTGAPVWFCIVRRRSWGLGFDIQLQAAPAEVADPVQCVAALNRAVESVIRQMPEQYWWSYQRYRRLPPSIPSPYATL